MTTAEVPEVIDTAILANQRELIEAYRKKCELLEREIERLKAGRFTEEEFQNLCHNFTPDDACRFKKGCEEYQKKLFGDKA